LRAGGSAGHNGLWALDCNEGNREDVGGRRYLVAVTTTEQAKQRAEQAKVAAKENQLTADMAAVRAVLANNLDGLTKSNLMRQADISQHKWQGILDELFDRGEIEECQVIVGNRTKPQDGIKLCQVS
jgi:hypothetical protein